MSARQGPHHVAQKSSSTYLPRNSENLRDWPSKSVNENSSGCAFTATPPFALACASALGLFPTTVRSDRATAFSITPATFISAVSFAFFRGRHLTSLHEW